MNTQFTDDKDKLMLKVMILFTQTSIEVPTLAASLSPLIIILFY